ncbi:M24 family metallopeptidase [Chthonobacter albigriseus]|uniref:M24 family metallopeptidase n=1 Tax=Chthonobacter albigriseus TaxID=1683161 RepID=UPI0015EF8302|nr:M24 family metallopeptidase [Chthonobacter albigriseus]
MNEAVRPIGHSNDLARVQTMHFGERQLRAFSDAEMQSRQDGLRGLLAEKSIDAAILTSYHNICYYSGFMYCYFGRRYAFVVTDQQAVSITAGIDAGQPWRRSYGDNVTYTDWRRDNFFYALQLQLPGVRRIGVEFDHLNVDYLRLLQEAFPGVEFVDIGQATMWMRTIKTPEEIALIRQGARVADIGGAACAEAIAAGVPEHEVALASTSAMVREIARTYPQAELMDTWTWFQSGINTDGAHNPVTSRKIESGDILSLNCFPMIFGYYTALERTLFCDHVDDASLKIWELNVKVHERGLELIKPGAKCSEIASELNEIYREAGLLGYRSFGYGHSFGVLSHYYGREAGVELREDIHTVLKPGMVVSMEPMLSIPDGMPGAGGYREHDILVVTESGADNITGFPYGPAHNIIAS